MQFYEYMYIYTKLMQAGFQQSHDYIDTGTKVHMYSQTSTVLRVDSRHTGAYQIKIQHSIV